MTDIHALAAANLVIEAASERLEVKKALFAQLAEVCPPQTLLTTNTSVNLYNRDCCGGKKS